ncbi:DUF1285 domain-containing protein [Microbulbifer sp. TYP-18]|uniref:DUF1285 domain-containing protein n=1 Tax=Microbulbifer sp. TYP-18 TaxID=3230024 RepID=UPI0034C5EF59
MAEPLFRQLQALQEQFPGLPPVHRWHPDLCGDMDLQIRADGRWIHEGEEIRREPLVRLFASILKREGDDYFLVTPAEKWRIQVEDAPFIATQVARSDSERAPILFTTNTGEVVPLDGEHAWQLRPYGQPPQPVPYIAVRDQLFARVSRDAYYQLIDWAVEQSHGGGQTSQLWLASAGKSFLLGNC